jgi:hypothetical protein
MEPRYFPSSPLLQQYERTTMQLGRIGISNEFSHHRQQQKILILENEMPFQSP